LIVALFGAIALFSSGISSNTPGLSNILSGVMGYYRALQAQGHDLPIAVEPLVALMLWMGLTALGGIAVAALLLTFDKVRAAFYLFMLTSAGMFLLLFHLVLLLQPYHSTKPISETILALAQREDLILHEDPLEYSGGLSYYTGRKIFIVNGKRGSLEFGSRYPEAREIFLDTEAAINLWNGGERIFFVTRLPREQSIVRLLPERSVRLIGEFGARRLYSNRE
jgi:hypothetical protein